MLVVHRQEYLRALVKLDDGHRHVMQMPFGDTYIFSFCDELGFDWIAVKVLLSLFK